MQRSTLIMAAIAALIAAGATASAAEREVVNGVTILRGRTPVEEPGGGVGGANALPGGGSGSSIYLIDRSGVLNELHTGSANAGGQIGNLPPGAGR
ncbi:MAG: hypothetical protein ACM3JG_18255 [Thiohalocapsa sp.]